MNPDHPNRERLMAFQHGTLDSADQEAVAAHVADCEACCQTLREIPDDAFVAQLRSAGGPPEEDDDTKPHSVPKELREHPRYKIGKFLGAGGMGVVFQAEHRLMNRVVALKVIHRDLSKHPRVLHRFHLEVKAAARLSHPNIVTAFDAEQAGDVHFLVMEFVDGVSLDRLVQKRGSLEVPFACNFMRQAARGLQHAFEAGMVHRDIKPQNVMLTKKSQIKLLDFGLARLASETRAELEMPEGVPIFGATKLGDIVGTPDFMAPEQALDSRQADIRADIYSLGCTFYYLLAGHPPFVQGSARTKILAQKYRPPLSITKLRDDVSPELAAVLDKMLAKDVANRYQTPAEVVKALAPFANAPVQPKRKPPPVSKKTPPPPARTPRPIEEAPPLTPLRRALVRCPFCQAQIRVPKRSWGASLQCPQCSSYFTAASG